MPRKPTLAGKNSVRNIPKGFRSSTKRSPLNHLVCCKTHTAFKEGEKLMAGVGWKRDKARRDKEARAMFGDTMVA